MLMKKKYIAPQTEMSEVELESGFMADSVYKEPVNTESLEITDHEVDETFDFSQPNENQWK